MKPFEQTCTRIAEALQTLVAEEAPAIRAGDYGAVADLQQRASPLVEYLARHAGHAGQAHAAIASLRAQRHETSERLAGEMARVRDELCALEFSRRRLARIGPAYARGTAPMGRLSAVG